jgi:prepilin-type N-terminal cleavage/methylation domain-containing protein
MVALSPGCGAILAAMPRGFTLVELLLTMTLAGALLALAVPGLGALRDRLAVDAAASAIIAAHTRARIVARIERRVAILALSPDSIILRVVRSPGDTLERWRDQGPGTGGVTTAGLPRTVLFAASGVTMGLANGTYSVSRGGFRRQVIVSRYGRIRVQ